MGYIASYFVHRTASVVAENYASDKLSVSDLLASVDLGEEPIRSDKLVKAEKFFDLFEQIEKQFADGYTVGIRVGATMCCDDYGAFGLAFKTACDLSASFQRVERFGKIVTSLANYEVSLREKSGFMALTPEINSRRGAMLVDELALAAGVALCREVTGAEFAPNALHFCHEAPKNTSAYEDYFRCPVFFGATKSGFEVSNELLFSGNRLGDHAVSEFFDSHLELELSRLNEKNVIHQRVAKQVAQSLSEGVPAISNVARKLGMSSRTLQRRLADEGKVYQSIVDETRRNLAVSLIERENYSLAEVAFLTGYTEQSTFTRAFKRWYGRTPAGFKKSLN